MGLYKHKPTVKDLISADTAAFLAVLTLPEDVDGSKIMGAIRQACDPLETWCESKLEFLANIIIWCNTRLDGWTRLTEAMAAEYNPISNYDRTESSSETENTTDTGTHSEQSTGSSSGTGSGTNINSGTETRVHQVAAFNSDDPAFTDSDKDTVTPATRQESRSSSTGTSSLTVSGSDSLGRARTLTQSSHVSGNIGVTTSQEMLTQELELRSKWPSIYTIIAQDFKREFCVGVW